MNSSVGPNDGNVLAYVSGEYGFGNDCCSENGVASDVQENVARLHSGSAELAGSKIRNVS